MESEEINPKSKEERQLRVRLMAKQIEELMGIWEEENGITPAHYEELLKQHFRSSMPKSKERTIISEFFKRKFDKLNLNKNSTT